MASGIVPACNVCNGPMKQIAGHGAEVWECPEHGTTNEPPRFGIRVANLPDEYSIPASSVEMIDEISGYKFPDVPEERPLHERPDIKLQTDLSTGRREHIQDSVQALAEMDRKPMKPKSKARANADMFGPQVPKRSTEDNKLGPVGRIIGTVVSLSIAAPFIIILWKWALALVF